jgi:hypothetical protein
MLRIAGRTMRPPSIRNATRTPREPGICGSTMHRRMKTAGIGSLMPGVAVRYMVLVGLRRRFDKPLITRGKRPRSGIERVPAGEQPGPLAQSCRAQKPPWLMS